MVTKWNLDRALKTSGWMRQDELEWLAWQASGNDLRMLEVGSYQGRSTLAMIDNAGEGTLITVCDIWSNQLTDKDRKATPDALFDQFKKNVGWKDFEPNRPLGTILHMPSTDAALWCHDSGNKYDFIFIDAAHDYANVSQDIRVWLPHCTQILAGHDYSDEARPYFTQDNQRCTDPDVVRAVDEAFGSKVQRGPGSIWYVRMADLVANPVLN